MSAVFHSIGISRLRIGVDGAGVTTLAAGYGCPLRCQYCLNPQCFQKEKPLRSYTVPELIREVAIDDLYFQATGGGVVFGGGEPLLYADFIHEFRQLCPSEWKVSLESSLAVDNAELIKVIRDIDFFLIDIKDMDPGIYKAYTGKDNDRVIRNLQCLKEYVDPSHVCIRIPLIKGFNMVEDQQRSRTQLEEMGFVNFDLFRYNIVRAEQKNQRMTNEHPDRSGEETNEGSDAES